MPKMGINKSLWRSAATSLGDALFSKTQQRVLGLLFGQPERSFYATELISLTGGGSGAVQRELARLEQSGLVTARRVGNQKHFQANAESPVYADLSAIVRKTVGLAEPVRESLAQFGSRILAAFVYGSVTKGQDTSASDIDLMLISDRLTYADIFGAVEEVGSKLGRAVNPTILTSKELAKHVKQRTAFVTRVLSQPKVWIVGNESALAVGKPLRTRQTAEARAA
jgi:predicted nucleotidyltransferase